MLSQRADWLQTPHGEWYCSDVGLVVVCERSWFAYPLSGHRLGPFASVLEAQDAAELHAASRNVRAAEGS